VEREREKVKEKGPETYNWNGIFFFFSSYKGKEMAGMELSDG
jgi:hypothetical protein